MQRQDFAGAEDFWKKKLTGLKHRTPLGFDRNKAASAEQGLGQLHLELLPGVTEDLEQFAKQHQTTLGAVVYGLWSLLLSTFSGDDEVLFGTTVSGRSIGLAGVESMVGMFINVLPFRVSIDGELSFVEWIRRLQNDHADMRHFECTPLASIQSWSPIRGGPLFESLVTIENYPVDQALLRRNGPLAVGELRRIMRTNYPLVLVVSTEPRFGIDIRFDRSRFAQTRIAELGELLRWVLQQVTAQAMARLREWQGQLQEQIAGLRAEAARQQRSTTRAKFKLAKPQAIRIDQKNGGAGPHADSDPQARGEAGPDQMASPIEPGNT